MLGTIVNTATIIIGSIAGAAMRRGIRPQYQRALFDAMGLCSLALGLNAFCLNLPKSQYPVLFIVSMAAGTLAGHMLDLDGRFRRLVDRKGGKGSVAKGHLPQQGGSLAEGLSTGILLYCIGTFSMVGPVLSALNGDNTYLYTNATLDLITSAMLATTYGIGMVWAAPVLFCWQGMFYLMAKLSADAVTDELRTELCIVGGVLIAAAGLNILKIKDCKTVNMLPAFLFVVLFFVVKGFLK